MTPARLPTRHFTTQSSGDHRWTIATSAAAASRFRPCGLGTMMFGAATDEPTSARIIARAREAGVNFIDTADAYSRGKRRKSSAAPSRKSATTGSLRPRWRTRWARGPTSGGLSRRWINAGCRRQLEAARHRPHRHLLPAQGRSCDATRRDGQRAGRPNPRGKNPLLRRFELSQLARRRNLQSVRPDWHRPPRRQPAVLSRHEPHARGRATCRRAAITASASCPTARSRAAS